jgi:hypothetical protein
MNHWLLDVFIKLKDNMAGMSVDDVPKIMRFLGFYTEVLQEQRKKRLTTSKGNFNKVCKDHLTSVAHVWHFFNHQQQAMVFNKETD